MPIKIEEVKREFIFNGTKMPDPNPNASPEAVKDILAATHPELANAAMDGPTINGATQTYTFIKSVGTKG